LKKCPRCDAHHLQLNLTNFTVDKKVTTNRLLNLDKTELPLLAVA
jgi:hypothetical protein